MAAGYQPAQTVGIVPGTANGWTPYRDLNAGTTGQVVKASMGRIGGGIVSNNAAAARFLKLYDKATAPTSSDTPVMTIQLPQASAISLDGLRDMQFLNGISYRASNAIADNDTTAPTANDVVLNLLYN